MDMILISNLKIDAVIGTLPHERDEKQPLILNIELHGSFQKAGQTDDFNHTFDYSKIEQEIFEFASNSSYCLLEALAEHVAEKCLAENPLVSGIRVRIDKPNAPKYAEMISIEITRFRQKSS